MDPIIGLGLGEITRLLDKIFKKIRKSKLKAELKSSLETPLIKTDEAAEAFCYALYTLLGASIVGDYVEPPSPSKSAEKLVGNVVNSYRDFIENITNLTKYFDTHLMEFREVLGDQEIIAIEALIKACESSPPDWKFLFDHGAMKKALRRTMKKHGTFIAKLKERFDQEIHNDPVTASLYGVFNKKIIDQQQLVAEVTMRVMYELVAKRLTKNEGE